MENILFVYENQLPDNFSENVEKAGITPKVATPGDELNFDKSTPSRISAKTRII